MKLHICGQTEHLWNGIASLAVDIIDCDSMVSLPGARQALGSKIVLAGNLNPVQEVCFSNPDAIRDGLRRCLEEAGMPFMATAGCEIPSGTPIENLKAFCEPIQT